MNEEDLVFGVGIKIWCVFCILGSTLALIFNCIAGAFDMTVLNVAGITIFVLLLVKKKKVIFYALLALAIIVCVLNLVKYNVGIVSALSGLLNPIITFAFLSKYWNQME